ncbi:ABC transporter ATP-binding protein/permease [Paenibacillus sp. P25]|nr:ABC transporter ATP-binding protein/permease [Paenibacillus sp. P25]
MNRRTSLYVLGRIQDRALHVPLERLEDPGYYDCLGRAQAAAGENLTGMLRQAAETVRLLFLFGGMLLIVSAGHSLISILLAAVTLFVLIGRSRIEIAVKRLNREWTTDGRMADYLKHSLAEPEVLKELKLFGAAGYIKRLWSGRMTAFLTRRNDFRRQENRMSARFAFAYTVAAFAGLALMVQRLGAGAVTAGMAAVVFQTIWQAQSVPMQLSFALSKLYTQRTMASDLAEFLNEPVSASATNLGLPGEPIRSIRFENVSFRYPGSERPVLRDLNVTLHAGQTVALAGGNGAGKSTFVKLMLGLFEPTGGRIWINGQELGALDRSSLWRRVSAVFQDGGHYPLTVREYLTAGMVAGAPDDRALIEALNACGLHSLAEPGGGLDARLTTVREGGRELSGGQWRLAGCSKGSASGGRGDRLRRAYFGDGSERRAGAFSQMPNHGGRQARRIHLAPAGVGPVLRPHPRSA